MSPPRSKHVMLFPIYGWLSTSHFSCLSSVCLQGRVLLVRETLIQGLRHSVLAFLWTSTGQNDGSLEPCYMSAFPALLFTEMHVGQRPRKSVTLSGLSSCWWCHVLVWGRSVTWLWKKLTSSFLATPDMVIFIKWFLTLGVFMENASVTSKLWGLLKEGKA